MSDEYDIFVANAMYPDALALFGADYRSIADIVQDCDVVLDTNVLLTPYTTGKSSLEQLRAVYGRLQNEERLFVPAQVAREYTRWRATKLTELYDQIANRRSKAVVPPGKAIPVLDALGTYGDLLTAESGLKAAVATYQSAIDTVLAEIRSWSLKDPVTELYRDLFGAKVVRELQFDAAAFRADLEHRFVNKIPPGYKDAAKEDKGVGDLLIWKTILELGAERQRDLLFVTGEEKADWQHRADNRGLFPRLELVDEYRRSARGKTFQIVSLSRLLELLDADATVVDEIREQEEKARQPISVQVKCPFCGQPVGASIQPVIGASAKPRCAECGGDFHVHWRGADDLLVNKPRKRESIDVVCPGCGADVVTRLGTYIGASAAPVCPKCDQRFHAHRLDGGRVVSNAWGGLESSDELD